MLSEPWSVTAANQLHGRLHVHMVAHMMVVDDSIADVCKDR